MKASTKAKRVLAKNIAKVTFVKKNGEKRVMIATSNLNIVPERKHPIGLRNYSSASSLRTYDLEKAAWRSMILKNVISVEKIK